MSPRVPRWPGDPSVEFEDWAEIERDGYFLRRFSMGEHSGTHLTAPASFIPGAGTADDYTPEEMFRPAVVIDIRNMCLDDRDYALSVEDLLDWEARHGEVTAGCLVLLLTGWASRWADPADYLGQEAGGTPHFPGFGNGAAGLLIDQRQVAGLGTDTAGVEPGNNADFSVSRLALGRQLVVLENLVNLDHLPPTGVVIVIGHLKLEGGSGSPASVMALVSQENQEGPI